MTANIFLKTKRANLGSFIEGGFIVELFKSIQLSVCFAPVLTITPRDQPFRANELLRFYIKSSEGGREKLHTLAAERPGERKIKYQ